MSYRNVDTEALKKQYAKKKKRAKKPISYKNIDSGSIDQRVQTYKMRKKKKKLTFKDETKKPANLGDTGSPKKPENLGDKGFKLKFGDAFRIAKKDGKKVFTWKGKKYTTQTKAELEAGKSEKAKFERKRKSNVEAAKSKKGFFSKVKSALGGDRDMSPKAVEKRRMEKRVAWMKKRKNQGKSYSAKNLKELEAKLSQ